MHVNPNVSEHVESSRSPLSEDALGHLARGLSSRLDAIRVAHDLDRRALLTSQRFVLSRDPAPSVEQFSRFVALPMAARLRKRAIAAIDAEFPQLCAEVVAYQRRLAHVAPQLDERARRLHLAAATEPLRAVGMDRGPLEALGSQWQRRLRRAAAARAFSTIAWAPPSEAPRLLDASELALVAEAPWAHGDRLLSAFEMAHADVRDHLGATLGRLEATAPGLTGRGLASAAAS